MVILGIDPGYAIVGYGVVRYDGRGFVPLEYGAVTTEAGLAPEVRLELVYAGILELLDRFHPDAVAIEELFFTNNQKTGILVAEARGVILLAVHQRRVPIYGYTPLQVKQAVVGYGKAVKQQVMEMTRILLKLDKVPKPDDAADALAIAICHGHVAGSGLGQGRLARAIAASEARDARRRQQIAAQALNQRGEK